MDLLEMKIKTTDTYIKCFPEAIEVFKANHDEIMELVNDDRITNDLLTVFIESILHNHIKL